MRHQQKKDSITENVLGKIKKEKIKMRPKMYFVFSTVLLMLGVLVLTLFIPYLVSLILFSLKISGLLFLPKFGFHGMGILFNSLPWFLILVTVLLIFLLKIFTQRFTFVYSKPIIYSLIVIVIIILFGNFLIEMTSFHSKLLLKSRNSSLPVIGMIYKDIDSYDNKNMYHGVIVNMNDDGFNMKTLCCDIVRVIVYPKTNIVSVAEFKKNDTVVVLGEIKDNYIQTSDIYRTEQDPNIFLKNIDSHVIIEK